MKRALLAIALAACGPRARPAPSGDVPWASSGIDWTTPPPVAATAPFVPPPISEASLDNGLRIVIVENHRLPIVALTAIHHDAGGRADGTQVGLAALTADLLDDRPGGARTANDLAETLERLGSRIETDIATDHASVQLVTLSNHLAEALEVFAAVNRDPNLTDEEVAAARERRIAQLVDRRTRARTIAGQVFDRVAFGNHPYAIAAEGTPEAVRALTATDVRAFYERAYRPDALTIVVAGDVTRDTAVRMIARAFGSWRKPHAVDEVAPPPLAPGSRQLAYVDLPGAEQTIAIIGTRTAAAGAPHQVAADVANAIVGGGVGARLDRKLHDELALTFGAGSSFWRGRWGGTWAVASTFRTEKTGAALRAALAVIETARTTTPTAAEVAGAKASLARTAAQHFETTTGTVRALERVLVQGFPPTRYAAFLDQLAAVTPASARAAIESAWADLSIVVVGDWSKIGPDLRALGLPVVQYRSDGTRAP